MKTNFIKQKVFVSTCTYKHKYWCIKKYSHKVLRISDLIHSSFNVKFEDIIEK